MTRASNIAQGLGSGWGAGADKDAPEFIVQRAHDRGVNVVELWVTDVAGGLHVVQVPCEALEDILDGGFLVDESLARSLGTRDGPRPELYLMPDANTFQLLPRPRAARLICDVHRPDGSPSPWCARSRLKAALLRVANEGATFYAGASLTLRWLEAPLTARPLIDPRRQELLAEVTAQALDAMSIPWRSHRRASSRGRSVDPSRWLWELDLVDPLTLADSVVALRRVAHMLASGEGCGATVMPHPWPGVSRASLDLVLSRVSPLEGAQASFSDPLHASGLSPQARCAAALIASELPALTLVLRGTVNSYTRPDPLAVKPLAMSRSEAAAALAIEGADACANPYLVAATLLTMAHRGALLAVPPEAARPQPQTLVEAARTAEESASLAAMVGGELIAALIAEARADAAAWRSQVTPFELERYL